MSVAATFDGAPEQGTINFSVGQPSADLLPLKLLQGACERYFAGAQPLELNYGERQGDARFRAALAAFLRDAGGGDVDPQSLMLTGGISQALDFACSRLTRPGDTVFVEEPSYPYAFPIFRDHGLKIVGIPLDGDGMDLAECERQLAQHHPKLLYTIPAYNNPTGQTLGQERRERLVELSREARFHHRGRRGLSAPVLRCATAGVVRHVHRSRQRAVVRDLLEDPGARAAARLDPGGRGADAHPHRQRRAGERRQFQSLHVARRPAADGERRAGLLSSHTCARATPRARKRWTWRFASTSPASRAGRNRLAGISSGSNCRQASTPGPCRTRRARPAPASCQARPVARPGG